MDEASAASPSEEEPAEEADAVLDAVLMVMVPDAPVVDASLVLLSKSIMLVQVAENPVTFLQLPPTVSFEPETKFTGAH